MQLNKNCQDTFWTQAKHNFGKWTILGNVVSGESKGIIGIVQERQCEDCGYKQINRQTYI